MSLNDRIENLRNSITPDLYDPNDFINWDTVQSVIERLQPGILSIKGNKPSRRFTATSLGKAIFEEPNALEVLMILTAIRGAVRFQDGRYIPNRSQSVSSRKECDKVASVFIDIGVDKILGSTEELDQQVLTAVVADQADRRRFPTKTRLEERVSDLVKQAIEHSEKKGIGCELASKSNFPPVAKRASDYVISIKGRNAIVIRIVFQAQAGGRQQRDLKTTYPNLKSEMERDELVLCLIADGQGIKEASDSTLNELLKGVPNCMTLQQAENGALADVIVKNQDWIESKKSTAPALDTIIESILFEGESVSAADLPSSSAQSRMALASYVEKHPDIGLALVKGGDSVKWHRPEEVHLGKELLKKFNPQSALELLARLIGAEFKKVKCSLPAVFVSPPKGANLPVKIIAFSSKDDFSPSLIANAAQKSFELLPDTRLSILIVKDPLSSSDLSALRRQQIVLTVNVIVLDVEMLADMAKGRDDPLDLILQLVLEQSDLEKVSPFVLRGATPAQMFYGREAEEAVLLGSLTSNSVAIIGGRRIGKTSLIMHTQKRLSEAGFTSYFCDCQHVRNWEDFGNLVSRRWKVKVPSKFKPHHLFDLMGNLSNTQGKDLVILMDEVDQLLDWDQSHSEDEAPEAFFRACRSISQQGIAQFVFSGERVISQKIWDPHSPHWNFCKPLSLRQLNHQETVSLITEPLINLGITIDEPESLADEVWKRTSGHPELVQFVGDALIKKLNTDSRSRLDLGSNDVVEVTDCFEYAEQYLETYWGQSTNTEKIISIFLSQASTDMKGLTSELKTHSIKLDHASILDSLRMLDLYGVIHQSDQQFTLKAEWFGLALGYYGGLGELIDRYAKEIS